MLSVEIEPRPGYVYARLSGSFTLESGKAVYRAALNEAARRGQPKILLDASAITGEMTVNDRLEFGTFVADEQRRVLSQLPQGPQLAILAVPPIMDPGRFTQTVASNRGGACGPRRACRSCFRGLAYKPKRKPRSLLEGDAGLVQAMRIERDTTVHRSAFLALRSSARHRACLTIL